MWTRSKGHRARREQVGRDMDNDKKVTKTFITITLIDIID